MKRFFRRLFTWLTYIAVAIFIVLFFYMILTMKYHAYEHVLGHHISLLDYLFGPTYIAPASK